MNNHGLSRVGHIGNVLRRAGFGARALVLARIPAHAKPPRHMHVARMHPQGGCCWRLQCPIIPTATRFRSTPHHTHGSPTAQQRRRRRRGKRRRAAVALTSGGTPARCAPRSPASGRSRTRAALPAPVATTACRGHVQDASFIHSFIRRHAFEAAPTGGRAGGGTQRMPEARSQAGVWTRTSCAQALDGMGCVAALFGDVGRGGRGARRGAACTPGTDVIESALRETTMMEAATIEDGYIWKA